MKVVAIEEPLKVNTERRFGFAADQNWVIPEDFDHFAEDDIAEMFGVKK